MSVHIHLNHLYQILLNLVNNALHAMNDKGRLLLYWKYKSLSSVQATQLSVGSGSYLCIGIKDSGNGIDERTMRSIFDPFFSTRPPGEGTGLGLSISQKIVSEWGGAIDAESNIGEGSLFTIYLPVTT